MSREQIDEMTAIINKAKHDMWDGSCNFINHSETIAEYLYNAGYRKQSEGKWVANRHISISKRNRTIHYETYKCSVCGVWNGRHKQKFCPNCGAHMKGGAE